MSENGTDVVRFGGGCHCTLENYGGGDKYAVEHSVRSLLALLHQDGGCWSSESAG